MAARAASQQLAPAKPQEGKMNATRLMIAAALLASAPATTAIAAPVPSQGTNAELFAYCSELMAEYPDLPLGVCMSFNLTQGTYGFVPQICHELESRGLLDDYGFESFSDCVRNAR
jgi:hypothetical protein